MSDRPPWDWRKAATGWLLASDTGPEERLFHAYDVNDNAACDVKSGLVSSCEPVGDDSELCPECWQVTSSHPNGRKKHGS